MSGFRAKAYVRNHVFTIDEPADLAGVDAAPNAVEYVLSALGGCLTVGLILNATKKNVKVENLEISLEGRVDTRKQLRRFGVRQWRHARNVKIHVYINLQL